MTPLPKQFFWENDSSQKFRDALQSEDIQRMIHDFMNTTTITRNVDMNLDAVENILISTAKRCLKIKTAKKRRCKISLNKKWFDKECRYKRHERRKRSNQKHRDPLNNTLREEHHNVLQQYKNLLKHKRNEYYSNKICELENTVENSNNKGFWNCLKSMDDTMMSCRIQRIFQHDLTPWITSSLKVKFALQLENSKTTNLLFQTKSKTK